MAVWQQRRKARTPFEAFFPENDPMGMIQDVAGHRKSRQIPYPQVGPELLCSCHPRNPKVIRCRRIKSDHNRSQMGQNLEMPFFQDTAEVQALKIASTMVFPPA